jgi:hypothetical protein
MAVMFIYVIPVMLLSRNPALFIYIDTSQLGGENLEHHSLIIANHAIMVAVGFVQ